jgi:hypothetical protein
MLLSCTVACVSAQRRKEDFVQPKEGRVLFYVLYVPIGETKERIQMKPFLKFLSEIVLGGLFSMFTIHLSSFSR